MPQYQADPDMAPDDEFEPGHLRHLVPGNTGRMLDARRTPVRVVGLRPALALVEVEVLAFEDRGARWELPVRVVDRYQFERDRPTLSDDEVDRIDAVDRSFGDLHVELDPDRRRDTLERLVDERAAAADWFVHRSRWARADRSIDLAAPAADERLVDDLADFLAERGLAEMDADVMRQYVSHPGAWEVVTGHAIVAAEIGLAAYRGPTIRDPARMSGDWSLARRADHLLARMAFTSTAFALAGHATVTLHRGMSFEHAFAWRDGGTFVSATFDRALAEEHATLGPNRPMTLLASQRVPVGRLLATYHETAAMNAHFREAEALLLAAPDAVF